jgi:hypothetical protein
MSMLRSCKLTMNIDQPKKEKRMDELLRHINHLAVDFW